MTLPDLDAPLDHTKRCIVIVTKAGREVRDDMPRARRGAAGSDAAPARAVGSAGLQVL